MASGTIELLHIPNHKDLAVGRLLQVWQGNERVVALVEALAEGTQLMEDELFGLIASCGLDLAAGDALDQWGALVGEERGPLTDQTYRLFVQARMQANSSRGTREEMIRIFRLVTEATAVRYFEMYPAGFIIQARRPYFMDDHMSRRVRRIMVDAKPAGVEMVLIEYLPGAFGFADDPDAMGYDEGAFARLIH